MTDIFHTLGFQFFATVFVIGGIVWAVEYYDRKKNK